MADFLSDFVGGVASGIFSNDYLRDFNHASSVFRKEQFKNSPKFKFLFHVHFDVNPDAFPPGHPGRGNFGLLVKTAKLPGYTFATHEMNQYNRKRIVQTKIKYDPVDITFHDDNGNSIRELWKAYYQYYYIDSTKPDIANQLGSVSGYNNRTLYDPSIIGNEDWGYRGEATAGMNKDPFFRAITIFSFHQHKYDAYTLINPIITRFSHDTHSYAEGNGIMENTMTLDYETVVYATGASGDNIGKLPSDIVTGFGAQGSYDTTLSPITRPGTQNNIAGQGGLWDGITGASGDLASGNLLGAIVKAGTTYNTFKNTNLVQLAKSEVVGGILNAVKDTPNRNNPFNIPLPTGKQIAKTAKDFLTVPPLIPPAGK